jgi:hypothetical protein
MIMRGNNTSRKEAKTRYMRCYIWKIKCDKKKSVKKKRTRKDGERNGEGDEKRKCKRE